MTSFQCTDKMISIRSNSLQFTPIEIDYRPNGERQSSASKCFGKQFFSLRVGLSLSSVWSNKFFETCRVPYVTHSSVHNTVLVGLLVPFVYKKKSINMMMLLPLSVPSKPRYQTREFFMQEFFYGKILPMFFFFLA